MISEPRWREQGLALSVAGILAVASLALGSLAVLEGDRAPRGDHRFSRRVDDRAWPERLVVVDEATARRDLRQAIQAWRDVYPVALASRRWEAMAAMGDAAARIDALTIPGEAHPWGFKPEARRAYLEALFDARSAGSAEGIERVASGFAALGDAEMASRARAMLTAR